MVLSIFGGRSARSVGSGISSATSGSGFSAMMYTQTKSSQIIQQAMAAGLPNYEALERKAGDIFFHIDQNTAGHTNMIAPDVCFKLDSVDSGRNEQGHRQDGVRKVPLIKDIRPALVFRFNDSSIARRAALLAESWVGKVRYSDGARGTGFTFRSIGAALGSSYFGLGAMARLQKYRSREGMAPKNLICSEMCILAYQLSMAETDHGFIRLDAKHTLPATFMRYLDASPHWTRIAFRLPDTSFASSASGPL